MCGHGLGGARCAMKKPGKGGNITIYDIAKKAGVSPSTVSRVINNRPGVGAATRKRLQKLLKEYNYFPNEAARSLVNQTSRFIGILIDDIRTIHHTEGAYIIERQLVDLGYCCMIFNTGRGNESKARYIEIMRTRRVDGVVMMGSTFQNGEVAASINQLLLITLFDRILLTIGGRQRQSIAPA
jgi:LacI family transcriptional regulator